VYKAKAKVRCPKDGTQKANDKEFHPNVAQAFSRIPSNGNMTLRASMDVWIGPGGWGMTPVVDDNRCTTGGKGSDFVDMVHAYQQYSTGSELGGLEGGAIQFDSETKSVIIPNVSGQIQLDQATRSFTFHMTVWETSDDDESWEMPNRNILWQGSAVLSSGNLVLNGFDSNEISLEDQHSIRFHDFSKSFTFSNARFDSIEVDIRYETEGDGEGILERVAEETSLQQEVSFTVFPNPISSHTIVSLRYLNEVIQEDLTLQIFDSKGQLVSDLGILTCEEGCAEVQKKITLSYLPKGLYYLSASSPSHLYIQRLIKD
jgi:hypothetical protein